VRTDFVREEESHGGTGSNRVCANLFGGIAKGAFATAGVARFAQHGDDFGSRNGDPTLGDTLRSGQRIA
jgi:hypothetical protein